ncbi:hypothetical protein E4T66_17335 [Sinimarinibacterium sp. CAU 1509]|uniref:hypothetical protein n=1 Tax=Sinimarinibacterium sp. CAU 1509 TaxID=2562283 RepID=UPI0010AD95D0|nr:hypothetical protein [Sinimarinibacterium sp. CAU 1509]TJY57174.1 hypothetical protein E4T66_17335 [Sinimarinibacterium sp. CAU 1509]
MNRTAIALVVSLLALGASAPSSSSSPVIGVGDPAVLLLKNELAQMREVISQMQQAQAQVGSSQRTMMDSVVRQVQTQSDRDVQMEALRNEIAALKSELRETQQGLAGRRSGSRSAAGRSPLETTAPASLSDAAPAAPVYHSPLETPPAVTASPSRIETYSPPSDYRSPLDAAPAQPASSSPLAGMTTPVIRTSPVETYFAAPNEDPIRSQPGERLTIVSAAPLMAAGTASSRCTSLREGSSGAWRDAVNQLLPGYAYEEYDRDRAIVWTSTRQGSEGFRADQMMKQLGC